MRPEALQQLLEEVANHTLTPEEAAARLAQLPFEDLGFARLDHHRALRTGMPEVVFALGKTPEQTAELLARIAATGASALATRATREAYDATLAKVTTALFFETARCIVVPSAEARTPRGTVAVLCAGTSDLPVAEEAAVTAEAVGATVIRITDVGVAGLHRLLAELPRIRTADAIVVCAGMEGALASVVAGLVAVPVIAVPTSIGYGASFEGLTALLGMLNSCSSNVTVVNIDNGFGAGFNAARIAALTAKAR
jgi:pyridinium-3,5-biscarboxylic acid mononucleotide synthase